MVVDFSRPMGFGNALLNGFNTMTNAMNSAKSREMQDAQIKALKQQQARMRDEKLAESLMSATYAAEQGDPTALKQLTTKYPDEFGGKGASLEVANLGELLGPQNIANAVVSNDMRNRYLKETGRPLPADPAQAAKQLQKTLVWKTPDGNQRLVSPEQLAAGMGKSYKLYKLQRQAQEAQLIRQINGVQEKKTAEDKLAELMAKQDAGETLSPVEQKQIEIYGEKLGINKSQALNAIASGKFSDALKQTQNKLPVDEKTVKAAKAAQLLAGLQYPQQKDVTKGLSSYRQMLSINQHIQQTLDKNTREGLVNEAVKGGAKFMTNEEFQKLDDKQQRRVLNKVMQESEIGMFITNYLKDVSGTAVTEEEFQRVLRNLTGGDLDKVNDYTLAAAFSAATKTTGEKVEKDINAIPDEYVGTKLEARQMLYSPLQPSGITGATASSMASQIPSAPAGGNVAEQVGSSVGTQIKDAASSAVDFAKGMLGLGSSKEPGVQQPTAPAADAGTNAGEPAVRFGANAGIDFDVKTPPEKIFSPKADPVQTVRQMLQSKGAEATAAWLDKNIDKLSPEQRDAIKRAFWKGN